MRAAETRTIAKTSTAADCHAPRHGAARAGGQHGQPELEELADHQQGEQVDAVQAE